MFRWIYVGDRAPQGAVGPGVAHQQSANREDAGGLRHADELVGGTKTATLRSLRPEALSRIRIRTQGHAAA